MDSSKIRRGDFYDDTTSHPCVCIDVNVKMDYINGISLLDGTVRPAKVSKIYKLTIDQVVDYKTKHVMNEVVDHTEHTIH